MKKLIMTALCSGLIYSTAICQGPTLSNDNFVPKIKQNIGTYMADTTGITFNDTGENHIWDYSTLKIETTLGYAFYVDPETTPYKSDFENATVANEAGYFFDYYYADNRNFLALGSVNPATTMSFDKPITLMQFPFSYGSQFNDDFYGSYKSGSQLYSKIGYQSVIADGWGTLKLPKNTYNNVLRLKSTRYQIDSASGEKKETIITKYSWYDGINNFPLLDVTSAKIQDILNSAPPKFTKYILVSDLAQIVSVPTIINSDSGVIYPNPADNLLTIESAEVIIKVRIYSLLGQSLFEKSFNDFSKVQKIDLLNLSSGSYLVEIFNSKNEISIKKLFKK